MHGKDIYCLYNIHIIVYIVYTRNHSEYLTSRPWHKFLGLSIFFSMKSVWFWAFPSLPGRLSRWWSPVRNLRMPKVLGSFPARCLAGRHGSWGRKGTRADAVNGLRRWWIHERTKEVWLWRIFVVSLLIVGEFVAEFEIGKRICIWSCFLQISKNKNQTFKWVPFFETKSCSHEIHDSWG